MKSKLFFLCMISAIVLGCFVNNVTIGNAAKGVSKLKLYMVSDDSKNNGLYQPNKTVNLSSLKKGHSYYIFTNVKSKKVKIKTKSNKSGLVRVKVKSIRWYGENRNVVYFTAKKDLLGKTVTFTITTKGKSGKNLKKRLKICFGKEEYNAAAEASDRTILEQMIRNLRSSGEFYVSNDLHSDQYEWEDGRLVGIDWSYCRIVGNLSLEGFSELKKINCNNNSIVSIDVSNNTKLKTLNCASNKITALDVRKNTELTELNCEKNQLNTLVLNESLVSLVCRKNNLTSLDVSKNKSLVVLNCYSNQLSKLDIKNNTKLESLYCDSNKLTTLDLSRNSKLVSCNCMFNKITVLDVSKNLLLDKLFYDAGVNVVGYSKE